MPRRQSRTARAQPRRGRTACAARFSCAASSAAARFAALFSASRCFLASASRSRFPSANASSAASYLPRVGTPAASARLRRRPPRSHRLLQLPAPAVSPARHPGPCPPHLLAALSTRCCAPSGSSACISPSFLNPAAWAAPHGRARQGEGPCTGQRPSPVWSAPCRSQTRAPPQRRRQNRGRNGASAAGSPPSGSTPRPRWPAAPAAAAKSGHMDRPSPPPKLRWAGAGSAPRCLGRRAAASGRRCRLRGRRVVRPPRGRRRRRTRGSGLLDRRGRRPSCWRRWWAAVRARRDPCG